MTLEELYRQAKNLTRQERINLAGNSGVKILEYLRDTRGLGDEKAWKFIFWLTGLYVGADGRITHEEWDLFVNVTGIKDITFSKFQEVFNTYVGDREFVQQMDEILDTWPDEMKGAACYYGLAFIAADGELDANERAVFEKILA